MHKLLYEAWYDPDDNSLSCELVSEPGDQLRRKISPNSTLVRIYHAATHEAAMQQHYAAENWGTYKSIPGTTDIPHTQQQFLDQQAWLSRRRP